MEHLINSDLVAAERRPAYLHEIVESSPMLPLFDLSNSCFDDSDFHVRFSGTLLGDAYLTRFEASAVQLKRSDREIAKRSSNLVLLALLDSGSYEQAFGYHAPFPSAGPGDLLLIDLDGPQTVSFARHSITRCAYIPRHHFKPFLDSVSLVKPVLLHPDNELYGLLTACLLACSAMRNPTPVVSSAALGTLTRLTLVAQGLHPCEDDALRGSVRDARRERAQQFIARHCEDPRLNPQMVADQLGVSLRSLNMAFEGSGHGVAASIMAARLDWARDMLLRFPRRSVLEIALSCGFNNLSSFYRSFAQAYSAPPGEFRALAQTGTLAQIGKHGFPDRHDAGIPSL
jgi:AraC-like DNA-binding protein